MVGTLVNAGAIIAGSAVGIVIHKHLPEKITGIVFQCLGLFTAALGVSMSLRSENMLLIVLSLVAGAIIGQAIDLEKYLEKFSAGLRKKFAGNNGSADNESLAGKESKERFSEGFITSCMLFCVGSMSVLGAIEDGTGQTPNLLFTKSIIDGISSIALASSFGLAVAFSSIPVLIYQGGITLFAAFVMRYMSDAMITDLTAVGGILLIGLGINILKIKELKVTNMLPSLVIIVILSYFFS